MNLPFFTMDAFNRAFADAFALCGAGGYIIAGLYSFILGACFGSFSTACVWRIPRNISILWPPSSCPKCGHRITPAENIPLFSYLMLRGKCSGCGQKISPRYFFLELTTAMLFTAAGLLTAWKNPSDFLSVIPCWVLIVLSMACACTDWELRIIPDKFTFTAVILGILCGYLFPGSFGIRGLLSAGGVIYAAGSALFLGLMLWGLALLGKAFFRRDALGLGDVKFIAASAALCGVITGIAVCGLGSLFALLWLTADRLRRGRWRRTFPFGPFLSAAAILCGLIRICLK